MTAAETLSLRVKTLRDLAGLCAATAGPYYPTRDVAARVRSALAWAHLHAAELHVRQADRRAALTHRVAYWLDSFGAHPHDRGECRDLASLATDVADAIEVSFEFLLSPTTANA